ncbi:MAG: N-glycosylase/DNA lyase [Candidatus Gracilibacteria bacterium]
MEKLLKELKKYTLEDALEFENKDRQFIALQKLYENFQNKNYTIYLALIICNSLICYQLSGKGEDYWEEFSNYFLNKEIKHENIIYEVSEFIKISKNNRRFIKAKIIRLEKLGNFICELKGKEEYYYKNMIQLRDELVKTMKQKKDAKTIVFAIKMFGYGARNIFDFIQYPRGINIPIDSRLTNLFDEYKGNYNSINKFYSDLSKKLDIPEIHLDAILWINYNDLINN